MRRFRLVNGVGEQLGEGVRWGRDQVSYRIGDGELATIDLSALVVFNNDSDRPDSIRGLRIDWLDPEPSDQVTKIDPFRALRDGHSVNIDGMSGTLRESGADSEITLDDGRKLGIRSRH